MDQEITDRIIKYMLHDPIGNVEGEIAEFDAEKLANAESQGAIFIAVYQSGKREVVSASDVKEPEPILNGTVLVQPVYVDNRMKAVCDVFDALESSMPQAANAEVATMALADEADAPMTFHEALAALKALVYGEEEADGDA